MKNILCKLGKHKPYITTEDGHFLVHGNEKDLKFKLFLIKANIIYTAHCLRCGKELII